MFDPNDCLCFYVFLLVHSVASWCHCGGLVCSTVMVLFDDFVCDKFAGTIDCLLSFVYFNKPDLSATSRALVIW